MIILGSVKADSRYSFYELKRSDPMEQILKEDKYSIPKGNADALPYLMLDIMREQSINTSYEEKCVHS